MKKQMKSPPAIRLAKAQINATTPSSSSSSILLQVVLRASMRMRGRPKGLALWALRMPAILSRQREMHCALLAVHPSSSNNRSSREQQQET